LPAYDPNGSGWGRLDISRFEHHLQDTLRLYRIRRRHEHEDIPSETSAFQISRQEGGFALSATSIDFAGETLQGWTHPLSSPDANLNAIEVYGAFQVTGLDQGQIVHAFLRHGERIVPIGVMEGRGTVTDYTSHAFDTSAFLREETANGATWELVLVPEREASLSQVRINESALGFKGSAFSQTIFVSPAVSMAHETLSHDISRLERAVAATPINEDRVEHLRLYEQLTAARAVRGTFMQGDIVAYDYRESPPSSRETFQSILEHVTEQLEVLAEYKLRNGEQGADALLVMADTLFAAVHHTYAFIHDDGQNEVCTQALRETMRSAIDALNTIDRTVLREAIEEYGRSLAALYPEDVPGHPDFREREATRVESRILPELENVLDAILAINQPAQARHTEPQQDARRRIA
ncbi:MAG: hypothetical protein J0L97_02105, partial [Alphaproteobacteria bacterium]|nr:hypothetical protein [Alphaproteobacteria bacterium]